MNEITFPVQSIRTLIKACIIALLSASLIFVTIILPSEYNIDLTGAGKLMGLTQLAEDIKTPVKETPAEQSAFYYQENQRKIIVPPNRGIEYKFKLQKHASLTYDWTTNGAPLFFDFHGEPKGDTTGYFESYAIATTSEMKGTMTVPFDGSHGWYWKNNSDQEVIVNIKTQGSYEVIGLIN